MSVVTLVKWGNSMGIRISAHDLKAANVHVGEKFKVTVNTRGGFNLTPITDPQAGWLEAFNAAMDAEKNPLLLGEFQNEFDKDEWKW